MAHRAQYRDELRGAERITLLYLLPQASAIAAFQLLCMAHSTLQARASKLVWGRGPVLDRPALVHTARGVLRARFRGAQFCHAFE